MLIRTNGIGIDYREEGSGIPVIFIHGFPLNQTMWDDQLVALKTHCRVITLDQRGFGGSEAPLGPYLMDQMAADVRGLMAALDIDRAVLAGLSMGGYVTLSFCRDYPDSVLAMVWQTLGRAQTHSRRESAKRGGRNRRDNTQGVCVP